MKTVAFHNLGCKVNSYEMDVMQQILTEKGFKIVPFDTSADIFIVNTCTVTNIADRKSRQMLHQAKKRNPNAMVVAVGCYVQTAGEKIDTDPAIDLAIGNNRKKDIAQILLKALEEWEQKPLLWKEVPDLSKPSEYEEMKLTHTAEHTRAYIKIQDGCNQFCSYCIIPFARGRVRSRKPEDVIAEVEGLAKAGYREIVVTGIHICSYGADWGELALLPLLQRLQQVEGIERIRLGSLEPRIVTQEFATEIAKLTKICPHFHLSLQSGCDATLKRMNRHYTAAEYLEGVRALRAVYDDPAITTDVIVGFPGETEEEFEECKAFLETVRFYEMHVFKYSVRQGTRAAVMPDQVPDPVKTARSDVLLNLTDSMSDEFRKRRIGRMEEVLFEEPKVIDGTTYQIGHTRSYIKVAVRSEEDLSGKLLKGTIAGALAEDLLLMDIK